MSQFFGSNPAARSPEGPKRGPWQRDVPRTWQEAIEANLKLAAGLREGGIGEPQTPPSVSPAPGEVVDESSEQSFPSLRSASWGPGLV